MRMFGRLLVMICCSFAFRQMVTGAHAENQKLQNHGNLSESENPVEEHGEATCNTNKAGRKQLEGINALQKGKQKQRSLGASLKDTEEDQKIAAGEAMLEDMKVEKNKLQKKSQQEVVIALGEEDATDMDGVEKTQQDEFQELDETGREKQDFDAQRLFDANWSVPTAIRSAIHQDKCLQVKGLWEGERNFKDGTNVELWPCRANGKIQISWTLFSWLLPTSGKGLIRFHYDPTKCLVVAPPSKSGTENLQIWSCNLTKYYPNFSGMQFSLPEWFGQKSGHQWSFYIGQIKWSAHMNKCIDIAGGGTSLGTNILLRNCNDKVPTQQFITGPFPRPIRWATHPNKCLDVSAGMNKDGTNIQLWDCPKEGVHENMQFLVPIYAQHGHGQIRWAKHPNKCLAVAGDLKVENGTNLQLWSCDSKEMFLSFGVPKDQGPFLLDGPGQFCIDVSGGGTAVGTNIQMWTCADEGQHPNMQFQNW